MQWLVLVPRLLEPIHRAFVDAGMLGGQFTSRDYACEFATPKWDYVNPQQDVQADIAEISVGLSSVSEKLRRRGYNPDDVFAEIASDFKKLKDLGVLDILLQKEKGRISVSAADAAADATAPAAPAAKSSQVSET
jgi:capsid protein